MELRLVRASELSFTPKHLGFGARLRRHSLVNVPVRLQCVPCVRECVCGHVTKQQQSHFVRQDEPRKTAIVNCASQCQFLTLWAFPDTCLGPSSSCRAAPHPSQRPSAPTKAPLLLQARRAGAQPPLCSFRPSGQILTSRGNSEQPGDPPRQRCRGRSTPEHPAGSAAIRFLPWRKREKGNTATQSSRKTTWDFRKRTMAPW